MKQNKENMKQLFEASNIGNISLKNRFIRSGTWMRKATEDGELTADLMNEYKKLAEGDLGLVIAGYARVNKFEKANNKMIGIYDDKFIEPLKEFTQMFHDNNTPVGIQIAMGGTQIHFEGEVNWDIMSPSPAIVKRMDEDGTEILIDVEEMTVDQIKVVIKDFADAAVRVKQAGFDMVQLHGGHGYFISQWLNPELNRRTDEYGIDKTKFTSELYAAVRAAVGPDFPIGIKINSEEKIGDESNHELVLDLCKHLDAAGIDMIEVSGFAPSRTKVKLETESFFANFAKKLKEVVICPVVLTGGNKTFSQFDSLVERTDIDYIGLSRTLVSEPDLIKNWSKDNEYKSRCVSCNHCHRNVYTCVFDK